MTTFGSEREAIRELLVKFPELKPHEQDLQGALCSVIREESGLRNGRRYAQIIAASHDMLLNWLSTWHEYQLTSIARFVATHRQGCVWAVLVMRELKGEQATSAPSEVVLAQAIEQAKQALSGNSNDAEHDALRMLYVALTGEEAPDGQ